MEGRIGPSGLSAFWVSSSARKACVNDGFRRLGELLHDAGSTTNVANVRRTWLRRSADFSDVLQPSSGSKGICKALLRTDQIFSIFVCKRNSNSPLLPWNLSTCFSLRRPLQLLRFCGSGLRD